MDGNFKRTLNIKGDFKGLVIQDNAFVDYETGEHVDVVGIISQVMHGAPFDLKVAFKSEEEC